MHELSIVSGIVDTVTESLAGYPGARVTKVRLRIGALAAIEEESLHFCYGIATEETPLAGSLLEVEKLPVIVHCDRCGEDSTLSSLQSFRCEHCGELTLAVLQGREMEIKDIELETAEEGTL